MLRQSYTNKNTTGVIVQRDLQTTARVHKIKWCGIPLPLYQRITRLTSKSGCTMDSFLLSNINMSTIIRMSKNRHNFFVYYLIHVHQQKLELQPRIVDVRWAHTCQSVYMHWPKYEHQKINMQCMITNQLTYGNPNTNIGEQIYTASIYIHTHAYQQILELWLI